MAAIVREIVKRGVITHHRAAWTLTAPLAEVYPGIPETLQQMLEIQFEQLSSEEQRVLESCSVAGERFSAWAASIMLGTLPPSIEEICDRLAQRQQFIRFVGIQEAANGAESAHYEFRHSLYRQALYRRLSSPNRSKLHRSLAEGLLPACTAGKQELASELALHFEEGRDYERATHYWMLTAENATARFSHRDAISILRHALEIVPATQGAGMELEIQIRQRVGDLHFALGEISHAAASYQSAAERAGSAGFKTAHVGALVRLAIPAWYLDSARGNEVSQEALEASKSLADPLLAARTQLAAASLRLLYDSWRAEDEETCAQARETIRRLTGSSLVQDVFAICVQTVQGDYQEALRHVEELIITAANPIAYILGLTAKALNLLPCGRFGEVLRIVRTGREMAEKNGEDPWIHIYCEAWLRIICFDHDGVGRLSQLIMRSNADQHATRARTIALVSSGQAETLRGNYVEALRCFAAVRDFQITPKFFLHWHWRMRAELGTVEAMLGAGDAASARREADGFLRSALSTADPNMRALAWEVKARVAQAQHDVPNARQYIEEALALADRFDIPVVAWQIHATASDLARQENDGTRVEAHRLRAQELIMRLADSFAPDEPLRRCLLAAPPVQRVLGQATSA